MIATLVSLNIASLLYITEFIIQIWHSLGEYTSGYKVESELSTTNLRSQYVCGIYLNYLFVTDHPSAIMQSHQHLWPCRRALQHMSTIYKLSCTWR